MKRGALINLLALPATGMIAGWLMYGRYKETKDALRREEKNWGFP